MHNRYGTRLPRSYELRRMSENPRALVIFAHRNALIAERAGLEVGFCWNRDITIDQARRSVDDRFRGLKSRADEFEIELFSRGSSDHFTDLRLEEALQRWQ